MGYFIRGHITPEHKNPINRILIALYRPFINFVLRAPVAVLVIALLLVLAGIWPVTKIGSEFMPDLDEGQDWEAETARMRERALVNLRGHWARICSAGLLRNLTADFLCY